MIRLRSFQHDWLRFNWNKTVIARGMWGLERRCKVHRVWSFEQGPFHIRLQVLRWEAITIQQQSPANDGLLTWFLKIPMQGVYGQHRGKDGKSAEEHWCSNGYLAEGHWWPLITCEWPCCRGTLRESINVFKPQHIGSIQDICARSCGSCLWSVG